MLCLLCCFMSLKGSAVLIRSLGCRSQAHDTGYGSGGGGASAGGKVRGLCCSCCAHAWCGGASWLATTGQARLEAFFPYIRAHPSTFIPAAVAALAEKHNAAHPHHQAAGKGAMQCMGCPVPVCPWRSVASSSCSCVPCVVEATNCQHQLSATKTGVELCVTFATGCCCLYGCAIQDLANVDDDTHVVDGADLANVSAEACRRLQHSGTQLHILGSVLQVAGSGCRHKFGAPVAASCSTTSCM